jgi:hypothetical protein
MISSILRFILIGFLAIVVLGVGMTVVGMALGLASLLLFKVAPLVLIGYVAVRLLGGKKNKQQISEADRKWLES